MLRLFPVSLHNLPLFFRFEGDIGSPIIPLEKLPANKRVHQRRAYRDCKKAWVRFGTTTLWLGTSADEIADYRAQRRQKEGFQGVLIEMSRSLLVAWEKPGIWSGAQRTGPRQYHALQLFATIGHISP